jgi:hypothetical protein
MYMEHPAIYVSAAKRADARALCALLNTIIGIGATTAFDTPLAVAEYEEYFLTGTKAGWFRGARFDVLGFADAVRGNLSPQLSALVSLALVSCSIGLWTASSSARGLSPDQQEKARSHDIQQRTPKLVQVSRFRTG